MKKVIVALCVVTAVVSVLFVSSLYHKGSSEQEKEFSDTYITDVTRPELYLFSTAPAPSYEGWETWDFHSCYHQVMVDGITYSFYTGEEAFVSPEKLGEQLYEFQWDDYRFTNNEKPFTVAIYEIEGTEKEKAVAVGREDGLQNGFFLYSSDIYNLLVNSETFGDFCNGWHSYSVQSSAWATYKEEGKEDIKYSLGVEARNVIRSFVESNADKKAQERESRTGERLCFDTTTGGINAAVDTYLCSDGYLYVSCGSKTVGYNVGTDEYNRFMKDFKGATCVWTPEHPVTIG